MRRFHFLLLFAFLAFQTGLVAGFGAWKLGGGDLISAGVSMYLQFGRANPISFWVISFLAL
jgi:hypothetical protein